MKNSILGNFRSVSLLISLGSSFFVPTGLAAEVATGKAKAKTCVVCHGQYGYSNAPNAPHLANQPEIYLQAQLRAFRDGTRKHQIMSVIAKELSDDDIDALAAWFASIEITVVEPEP